MGRVGERGYKFDFAPAEGEVHVDEALGAPDPVVFGVLLFFRVEGAAGEVGAVGWDANVVTVLDGVLPLHAGEVDAPAVTGVRWAAFLFVVLLKFVPGEGKVGFPAAVFASGVVEGAVDDDLLAQAFQVAAEDGNATLVVGFGEGEFPDGAEGVHLELVVVEPVTVGVDEDLDVVVVKDDFILFGDGAPDMRFFHLDTDVKELLVPRHLAAGAEAGFEGGLSGDVDEVVTPRDVCPVLFAGDLRAFVGATLGFLPVVHECFSREIILLRRRDVYCA